jgi:hypothetical protein
MTFTDDDLKRLKENMDRLGDGFMPGNYTLRPLLARLEAAEKRASYHIKDCHCQYCLNWREAAEK